jgi:ectoine hydroxylase-related dioxygenase (phytanoyl-CoA dioxygenase family)
VIAEYWERGYWISPKLFDDDQISRLRAAHDRLWAGDHDYAIPPQYGVSACDPASPKVRQQCNAFWLNDEMRRAITAPIIGAIGARLMGVASARLWHDQAIYKPGLAGQELTNAGNVGWHQDYAHWQCSSSRSMCTAWIALQDTDLHNGGMRTIVGSHKWGLQKDANTFGHKDLDGLREKYAAGRDWIDEPCILKAGEVSFHHNFCFHGSGPNLSDQPRLCLISHMMPQDCALRTDPDAKWHLNCVLLGPHATHGTHFAGPYFPTLWPAADAE